MEKQIKEVAVADVVTIEGPPRMEQKGATFTTNLSTT